MIRCDVEFDSPKVETTLLRAGRALGNASSIAADLSHQGADNVSGPGERLERGQPKATRCIGARTDLRHRNGARPRQMDFDRESRVASAHAAVRKNYLAADPTAVRSDQQRDDMVDETLTMRPPAHSRSAASRQRLNVPLEVDRDRLVERLVIAIGDLRPDWSGRWGDHGSRGGNGATVDDVFRAGDRRRPR